MRYDSDVRDEGVNASKMTCEAQTSHARSTIDSCTDSQHVVEQLPNADGHLHLHTNHSIVSTVTHASSGVPVARTFQKKSDVSESPNTVLRNREITTAANTRRDVISPAVQEHKRASHLIIPIHSTEHRA